MKTLSISAAAIAVAGLILAAPVIAQQAGPGPGNPPAASGPDNGPGYGPRGHGWGPGMMMGPGMMGWSGRGMMCDPRAAGLAEWRMDRIEHLIDPNEAQRAALDALRAASRQGGGNGDGGLPARVPGQRIGAAGNDGEASRHDADRDQDRPAGLRRLLRHPQ